MAFRPPLPRIAGPYNLPTLLSILPKQGQHQIVKPSTCRHPNRVFVVTRSKLKFSIRPAANGSKAEESAAESSATGRGIVDGEVKAHGKVWAMEFVNGQLVKSRTATKLPDPRVRTGLKHNWIAIDPKALPSSTKTAVENWKDVLAGAMARREKAFDQRAVEARERRAVHAREKEEVKARIAKHEAEKREVKILY